MGLFYALIDNQGVEYLLTFASCDAANEWWRAISTSPSPYAGKIRRASPQFFIYEDARIQDVRPFWICPNMHIKLLSNAVIIPSITATDHISGGWYFIRSRSDPRSHWYVRIKGVCLVCGDANCDAVHVSSEYRTKFCIRARDAVNGKEEIRSFVMIERDEISITAPKGYILHVDGEENLRATMGYQGETNLRFGDLRNRFITQVEKQVNGEIWESVVAVEKGMGEAWELVD